MGVLPACLSVHFCACLPACLSSCACLPACLPACLLPPPCAEHHKTPSKRSGDASCAALGRKPTRILEGILHLSAAGRPMGSGGMQKTLENTPKSGKWQDQRTQNQQKMLRFSQKRPRRPRGRNSVSHSGSTAILKKTRSHARREAQK